MTHRVLVTGATGNTGAQVLRLLRDADARVRVAARRPAALSELPANAEPVAFDFTNPDTWLQAFEGVERIFLVRPPNIANIGRDMEPALQAARRAGVQHIVFLSLLGVERKRMTPHYKVEQTIRDLGFAWTFLRAGFFMQNLNTIHAPEIRERDQLFLPAGNARTAFIDVRDIAAVAARALLEDGHEGRAYELTGDRAISYDEAADVFSEVLGREIVYARPSVPRYAAHMLRRGEEFGLVLVMCALYTLARFGDVARVRPDVREVLGRDPISLREYVEDYRAAWER